MEWGTAALNNTYVSSCGGDVTCAMLQQSPLELSSRSCVSCAYIELAVPFTDYCEGSFH